MYVQGATKFRVDGVDTAEGGRMGRLSMCEFNAGPVNGGLSMSTNGL